MPSNFTQSEDCLYLNIYVPVGASALNQKSVMVWIHGGGYIFGDGTRYDGSFLSGIGGGWIHDGPNIVASNVPSHDPKGTGSSNLRSPIGGFAKGILLNTLYVYITPLMLLDSDEPIILPSRVCIVTVLPLHTDVATTININRYIGLHR
jgi:hypothetical protein